MEIRTRISGFVRERPRTCHYNMAKTVLMIVPPVVLGCAVHLGDVLDTSFVDLALEVAGGVGKLGEDEHLLAGEALGLEQSNELVKLVIMTGLELSWLRRETARSDRGPGKVSEIISSTSYSLRSSRSTSSSSSGGM